MKEKNTKLLLNIPLNSGYVRLVTLFIEEAAKAFGLDNDGAVRLTLAGEEIFAYLSQTGRPDEPMALEAMDGHYYVQIRFLFHDHGFNPRAFNITAQVAFDDRESLNEMGLLIAARTVDRFHITAVPSGGVELVLTKEKAYPEPADLARPEIQPARSWLMQTPDPENLKLFSSQITACYPENLFSAAFGIPGKIVDMVASGDYGATLAIGEKGQIGGGVLWRWIGNKTVESFGPYLFNPMPSTTLATELLDACLQRITKTSAVGLIHHYATPELPQRYFESIGTIDLIAADGLTTTRPVYYRHLNEDLGCRVWVHPDLEDFLRTFYQDQFFAREIRLTQYGGEQRPAYSVLAPQFDRVNGKVTLHAIWDGADIADNLARHVAVFKAEKLRNLFFEVDLGCAWQANLVPALLANAFRPRLLLPYGGEADIVVFQHSESQ